MNTLTCLTSRKLLSSIEVLEAMPRFSGQLLPSFMLDILHFLPIPLCSTLETGEWLISTTSTRVEEVGRALSLCSASSPPACPFKSGPVTGLQRWNMQ